MSKLQTNGPFTKLGRIAIRKYPFANFDDVVRDAKLQSERDLRAVPMGVSGGMRKALTKERHAQDWLRRRSSALREHWDREMRKCYGLLMGACPHCQHVHFFDEAEADAPPPNCDRCKRPLWK